MGSVIMKFTDAIRAVKR